MYLKELHIKNFRCIEDLSLEFNEGLNVIIGENNTGKTAIIDALRLAFSIGMEKREIYLSSDDFFRDKKGNNSNTIEFDFTFANITDEEQGIFIELLSIEDNKSELQLHLRYTLETKNG